MSGLLFGHDQAVAEWVSNQKYGKPFHPPYTAIGVITDEGKISGGFVFTTYTGSSVNLSLAGDGVVYRGAWRGVLHYVFEQMKCSRLECHTAVSNKIVRRSLPRLGFKFEGTARRLYGAENGLCFSLTVDDLTEFRRRWRI